MKIAELANMMRRTYAKITGDASFLSHPIVDVPARTFYGEGYEDCDRRMPDTSKARHLLDWHPTITLDDLLLDALSDFYEKYRDVQRPQGLPSR